MKTHTQGFKNQIKELGREIDSKITYGNTIISAEELFSVSPILYGDILKSVMKQLDFESSVKVPVNTIINYKFGLKVDGKYEYVDYGNYVVYSNEYNEDTKTYKHVCYDKLLFTMKEYKSLENGTFPMTVRDYITNVCLDCGLLFIDTLKEFANYDKTIESDLYANLGYTYRDVLDELAQVTASTICLNKNDSVEIRYITETNDTIDSEYLKDVNVKFGEKYGPINSIVLSRSAESDNVYLSDEQSIAENGLCELKIVDNQIMNDNNRSDFLPDILEKLNGLEYYINDFTSTGILYYDLCDRYTIQTEENTYSCVLFNDEPKITQGIVEDIYTERPIQSETDYNKADKTDRRLNQAYLIINKQEKTLEGVLSEQTSQGKRLAKIEGDTSSLKLSVSETKESIENLEKETGESLSNLKKSLDSEVLNLQNQIDGSIQFWNGAEVPTLENEPAVNWKDEPERNNHRADIYTVIINNEQGKSYRFDKVNDNWVWVEITDNELSAVKALVDEAQATADGKMKVFSNTPTVPYQIGDLWWKDGKLYKCFTAKDKNQTFDENDWQESDYVDQDKFNTLKPTDESEGTKLTLENSAGLNTVDFRIDGNYHQETRSGKNLINVDEEYTFTRYVSIPINLKAGTYKVLCNSVFVNDEECYDKAYIRFLNNSGSYITKNKTFTLSNDTTEIRLYANGYSYDESAGYTVVIDQLMIINDSVTDLTYEPYGISPSPDYPSEVEVIEGYNLLENVATSQTINGITFDKNSDGTITANGTSTSAILYEYILNSSLRLDKGVYLVSDETPNPSDTTYFTFVDTVNASTRKGYSNAFELITKTSLQVRIVIRAGVTLDNVVFKPMIIKGTTSKTYLHYQNIGVKNVGKNILDYSRCENGGFNYLNGQNFDNVNMIRTPIFEIKPNTTYTLSCIEPFGEIAYTLYDRNKVIVKGYGKTTVDKSITFTTTETTKFIKIRVGYTDYPKNISNNYKLQLEEGNVVTEYEPYKETITALDLKGEFIGKLPNGTEDYLTVDNQGNYGIQKKVARINLGELIWTHNSSYGFRANLTGAVLPLNNNTNANIICDNYTVYTANNCYALTGNITSGISLTNSNLIIVREVNYNDAETFKSVMEGNFLYYELAEPYYVELGKAPINTLEGNSTMHLLSTLDTNMYCKYMRKNDNLDAFQTKEDMGYYYNKSETDTQINITANAINQNVTTLKTSLDEKGKTLASLEKTVNQKIEDDKATIEVINNKFENGVEKLKNRLVTIDIEGLKVATNTSKISSLMSNDRFVIRDNAGKNLVFIGYDEVEGKSKAEMDNLYVSNYFTAGYHRQEKMRNLKRTGWFYVGGNK